VVWYLDTSAFLKLIVEEASSSAMRDWYSTNDQVWSSQFLCTEALRAARCLQIDPRLVEEALDTVTLVLPSVATYASAGRLEPYELPSLDALHIAAALEIGSDLEGMVVYDQRLADVARDLSIEVVVPS
jgi:uncharacterized protein